jgi:ABC-type protease/lipase transport system fused ATPase/permease subunit
LFHQPCRQANDAYLQQQANSDTVGEFGSLSRVLRMIMQSAVLGIGAYLVINQEATAGVMLAATILSALALAPVELAIANWRSFVNARQGWRRLSEVLAAVPGEEKRISLPPPARNLRVTAITRLRGSTTSSWCRECRSRPSSAPTSARCGRTCSSRWPTRPGGRTGSISGTLRRHRLGQRK